MQSTMAGGFLGVLLALTVFSAGCDDDDDRQAPTQTPTATIVPTHTATQTFIPATSTPTFTATPAPTENPIQSGTVISLTDGTLEGEIDGAARRFLGIPYAAPPVGELRWRPPQPPVPWEGIRPATEFGGRCAQPSSQTSLPSNNEDCLYLNVWTPEPAPAAPLPVMVWFHGGSNLTGSTSDPVPFGLGGLFYDGQGLTALADVVVVTVDYRLGVMGFFAHAALDAEDPERPYSGDQGLQDQRASLEWVQANIRAFGGDPDNVTIFGESAGSWDVCLHQVSPASRGLFHRAISESGGCTTLQRTIATAEQEADVFAEAVGCGEAGDVLACLRSRSPQELMIAAPIDGGAEGDVPGGEQYRGGRPRWSFNVVVDGDVLPDQPRTLFDSGDFARVPYILGSNSDEGTLFHIDARPVETEEEYLAALERVYGDQAAAVAAEYPVTDFATPNDALVRVTGDSILVCTTYDAALRAQAGGSEVFLYNFSHRLSIPVLEPLGLGATHGLEIAYVFGSYDRVSSDEMHLSEVMRGYWGRFAWNGDPNGDDALEWPAFAPETDQRMNFDLELSVVSGFRTPLCEFWRGIYDLQFEAGVTHLPRPE